MHGLPTYAFLFGHKACPQPLALSLKMLSVFSLATPDLRAQERLGQWQALGFSRAQLLRMLDRSPRLLVSGGVGVAWVPGVRWRGKQHA